MPEVLSSLVGQYNNDIPDDIIEVALNLLKMNSDVILEPYMGFKTPCELKFLMDQHILSLPTHIPDDKFSINIHPLTNHWVTTCYDPYAKTLKAFDSLKSDAHLSELIPQVELLYGKAKAQTLQYVAVTQQTTEPICGVMAIAFAFSCFLGMDPATLRYDTTKARNHLRDCIINGNIRPFPVCQLQPTLHHSASTSKTMDATTIHYGKTASSANHISSRLKLYFADQDRKRREKDRLRKQEEKKMLTEEEILLTRTYNTTSQKKEEKP